MLVWLFHLFFFDVRNKVFIFARKGLIKKVKYYEQQYECQRKDN